MVVLDGTSDCSLYDDNHPDESVRKKVDLNATVSEGRKPGEGGGHVCSGLIG